MSTPNVNSILNTRASNTIDRLRSRGQAALEEVIVDAAGAEVSVQDLAVIISGRKSKSVETKVRRALAANEAAKLLGEAGETPTAD